MPAGATADEQYGYVLHCAQKSCATLATEELARVKRRALAKP